MCCRIIVLLKQLMMKNCKKYIVVFLILCFQGTYSFAQAKLTPQNSDHLFPTTQLNSPISTTSTLSFLSLNSIVNAPEFQLPTNNNSTSCMLAPKAYNYHLLGAFCKIDVQLEKVVQMPVKFRLGTVNYVDKLEGKGKGPNY